jgi:hypothetical protein
MAEQGVVERQPAGPQVDADPLIAPSRRGRAVLVAAAVLALVAAVAWAALRPAPDPVAVGSEADARQAARTAAEQVAALVGEGTALTDGDVTIVGCPNRADAFAGRGTYELGVPVEGQVPLLGRLSDEWRAQGYAVTAGPPGRTVLTVSAPAGPAPSFTLLGMAPRPTIVLVVQTTCYRRG